MEEKIFAKFLDIQDLVQKQFNEFQQENLRLKSLLDEKDEKLNDKNNEIMKLTNELENTKIELDKSKKEVNKMKLEKDRKINTNKLYNKQKMHFLNMSKKFEESEEVLNDKLSKVCLYIDVLHGIIEENDLTELLSSEEIDRRGQLLMDCEENEAAVAGNSDDMANNDAKIVDEHCDSGTESQEDVNDMTSSNSIMKREKQLNSNQSASDPFKIFVDDSPSAPITYLIKNYNYALYSISAAAVKDELDDKIVMNSCDTQSENTELTRDGIPPITICDWVKKVENHPKSLVKNNKLKHQKPKKGKKVQFRPFLLYAWY